MTIEGVSTLGRAALDGVTERSITPQTAPPYAWNEVGTAQPNEAPHRPRLLRGALFALHHRELQNAPTVRAHLGEPAATWPDRALVKALETGFGLLHAFLSEGRLTCSALRQVAADRGGHSEELDRTAKVVREILKRPSLIDAIMSRDGDITRDSLRAAAASLTGNSSPSEFSQDPFHAQGNDCVVQALQAQFEQLRDPTKDRTFLFEPYQYLAVATLMKVMQDPYDIDREGNPVIEPSTGMPRPKYSELCVYAAKNIIERPGLLPSLERVNSPRLFGPPHHEGYVSNKSLDQWRERYKDRKAR